MEDAPEDDRDVKLQKASSDLIADFDRSLTPFLRKPNGELRTRVRISETARLTSTLLDPFQELPQLLDPHLPKWLPLLAASPSSAAPTARAQLLEPLPAAIARLVYTLTKIRGAAVILRFLPVEARHLEPLLAALESAERRAARPSLLALTDSERYLVLLWLAQLLLAPFDLSTISSADPADDPAAAAAAALVPLPGFAWPRGLPAITTRVLPLAVKYLASPGKERDGARHLLVRLSMRRDMQSLGVLDALVSWALASLRPRDVATTKTADDIDDNDNDDGSPHAPEHQPYFHIGVLSFLAGVLRASVNTSDMDASLSAIFTVVHAVSEADSPIAASIRAYAVARKMVIKVIRSIAVLLLGSGGHQHRDREPHPAIDLVELAIGYLLERLADNDTPVRLAASKALSVITLKLDPDMADEVVDAVLDALNRNVLWAVSAVGTAEPVRDLSAVDPLEWHGLTLTLSHLLYRRSPPARQLPAIIAALLLALAFEKRSTSGSSVGANVRDAACFGIWALARRYTTAELLARLATELTVTASLDPAGNIRRGASAALQELIGRHPDTVDKGIWLVQTVDYHAVALRARALHEGALKAAKLSPVYGRALLRGLLDWRGVGDPDAGARRVAGASFGTLTRELSSGQEKELTQFQISAKMVLERLAGLQNRQVEERHGLLLCLASVLDKFPSLVGAPETGLSADNVSVAQRVVREVTDILQAVNQTTYRRPELVAEAANRLIIASLPVLQASSLGAAANTTPTGLQLLCPGFEVVSPDSTQDLLQIVAAVDALPGIPSQVKGLVHHFEATISAGLSRPEKSAIAAAAEAALVLLAFSEPAERNRIVTQWAATTRQKPTSRTTSDHGYFAALTMAHPLTMTATRGSTSDTADAPGRNITTDAILSRWASDKDIDTRVAILQSLTESVVLQDGASAFLDLLAQGLNDYTTTARGDVGSHVRLGALRATRCIWRSLQSSGGSARQQEYLRAAVSKLYLNVLRLAAEKLDRVRTEAQAVLSLTLTPSYAVWFNKLTFSSRTYLLALLTLYAQDEYIHPLIMELARADPGPWMAELLAGYVTSADTGNEDLVIAARAALTEYCSMAPANRDDVCTALVRNLSSRQGQDRVLVPTLEIVAFLYRAGLFAGCRGVDPKRLCLLVQKAGYKTGSIRKLEACIHVYGCVAMFEDHAEAAAQEARKRLGALMFHPWPRVRSLVVDELWQLFCDDEAGPRLKSVDWGRADKGAIRNVVSVLGLA
ncbi:Tubulin-specific chaperone D like protein [Verticillium longisporum]|uniref:Tubulin-specific chaperone D like protein n=1 Tax=Verticillium longisporum TaxID=100787 RepID=A0A8I2ZG79_VERLO|nr:Tubulin-specific chaperone D like protein [Verticillium longisporum]